MKKLAYFLLISITLLNSCKYTAPLDDDLDKISNKVVQTFTYALTEDDYASIAKRALYLNPVDTTNANFILSHHYFTDSTPAATYVPMFMDQTFPNMGSGTQAKVTYPYRGNMPEDLSAYVNAPQFTFTQTHYQLVSEDVATTHYFFPLYNPDSYIPNILKEVLDTASTGAIYAVTYNYADVTPKINYGAFAINPVWETIFENIEATEQLQFINSSGPQAWAWTTAGNGAVFMDGWETSFNANENWMITPEINLSGLTNVHLQLTQAIEYYTEGLISILVSTNYDGTNPQLGTWTTLPFPSAISNNKNRYHTTNEIDVSAFDNKKIHIAFKYSSTTNKAPYWGIGAIKIGPFGYAITGATPYKVKDFYTFDGANWSRMPNATALTDADYTALGISTNYLLAADSASILLPQWAHQNYPYAAETDALVVLYNYNNGDSTIAFADRLTKTLGNWTSTYAEVIKLTEPYAATNDGWVFDPTVIFSMGKEDYLAIATYVKNNTVLSALDENSYDDSEYYYGASAYYQNFDTRNGKFYSEFATWQAAVTEAIGKVLLPIKYPQSDTNYKGIDLCYVIHFETYGAEANNYSITFQCTKAAPNPEFTLITGPTAE